jgi:hypothetical protein
MIDALTIVYGVAAALFAGHALLFGVALGRRARGSTGVDTVILTGTALLAGAAWVLFAPALLVRAAGRAAAWSRRVDRPSGTWTHPGLHAHP